MSRQIEQALFSLMPGHGPDLPPTLVELTASLLAQSWNRASTLKAEEEVARSYACANIACERLKISLNLPPIEPRPPIPPRIYKRLYTHLENILPSSCATPRTSRIRTPNSRQPVLDDLPASRPRRLPARGMPTKNITLSQFRTPPKTGLQTTPRLTGRGRAPANPDTALYSWVKPVVRFLCADSEIKMFTPTALAGVEFIMAPGGQRTKDDWINQHASELVAVVFFFVMLHVRGSASGETLNREDYISLRQDIIARMITARTEVEPRCMNEYDFWKGWRSFISNDFDTAVTHVNQMDWLAADWYKGLADLFNAGHRGEPEATREGDDNSGLQLPTRRADTMLQEQYDLLSETRRSGFQAWKNKMLSKMGPRFDNCV